MKSKYDLKRLDLDMERRVIFFLKSHKQQTSSEYCIKIGTFSILVISSEIHVSEQLLYTRNVEMSYELSHISHLQIQILDSQLLQL